MLKSSKAEDWISVDDQEPNEYGKYLTYWSDGFYEVFELCSDQEKYWEGFPINGTVLTHWMPLPEPPNDED